MVVDVESRAESMMGGKMAARACDACMRRSRASWYCPADDAFLCQSCDASIHSANHLSKRHERVQLQSSSTLPELMTATRDKTTSVWYEGFRRKARTPRSKLSQIEDVNNSNDPLVPELGVEEEEDGVFSFSSTDENEESLNCCVPVFDTFSDMVIDDIDSFRLVPDGVNNSANGEELGELEREIMGNEGLIEFLPLDMDLGELITMDVESLLEEEEPFLGVKEVNSIGVIKEENNVGFEISSKELERVKDEEEEEAKCVDGGSRDSDREASKDEDRKMSLFLRLDYESVISAWDIHGSPWKTGIKPEFNLGDWRECLLGGNTYPSHVMGGFEELASAVGSVTRQQGRDGGRSNGERGAKVLRYREKRRTRLFAKKIRYEVRKLNAEQRPRIKDKVVLVSYNLLGVDNASNHMDLYYNVPPKHLEWSRRKHLICKEISRYNASILCLQEVDRFDELDCLLRNRGFRGVHKSRTGEASDGCAIFWKEKLFKLLDHQHIEFDRFGMRNNVAQLCVLEMNHEDPKSKLSVRSPEQTSTSPRRLVVGNIHVLFNPKRGDIKLGQVRLFLEKAYKLSQEWGNIPVAIAGDLNSTPQSAIYDFIASADLDTQLHDRRQVSGQSEMEPNERSFRNHYAVSAAVSISRSLPNEWSQEELQLATGGQATTHVQHQLKLHSAYSGVPGTHRTRDQRGEPLATTYHSRSHGTVDYIWHTKELVPVRVLETLPTDVLRRAGGLPSEKWGSDHLAIACELGFVND